MTPKTRLALCLSIALAAACAAHEDTTARGPDGTKPTPTTPDRPDPTPQPEPEPEPAPQLAKVGISSVTMVQDCPDPKRADEPPPPPEPPASEQRARTSPGAMAKPARRAAGASMVAGRGHGPRQRCTQSTMQISFASLSDAPQTVSIDAIRLVRPDTGATVGALESRGPTAWDASGSYTEWDEQLGPKQEVKASYKLGVPDWTKVEAALGGEPSMGHMFVIEVDVSVGDQTLSVRSPEFARERPHVIVT